jgi:hypothetical protein
MAVILLNKTDWLTLAEKSREAFRDKEFMATEEKRQFWYEYVKFMDLKTAKHAMRNFILTSKYPPSISEYIEMYNSLVGKSKDANLQIKTIYKNMESYYPMSLRDKEAKDVFVEVIKADDMETTIENATTIANGIINCVKNIEKKGNRPLPVLSKCIRECKEYVDKQNQ